jgi:hypothetical protein
MWMDIYIFFTTKLLCVLLESGGSRAELTRSRGCLDEERQKWSGSRENIFSRCGFAPSFEIPHTEPLRSYFSLPSLMSLACEGCGSGGARARARVGGGGSRPGPALESMAGGRSRRSARAAVGARSRRRSSPSALLCSPSALLCSPVNG